MRTTDGDLYLDHNATTPVAESVVDAMLPFLRGGFGNPSSDHAMGRAARAALEEARAQVAALIGASADEIVFTSGGTEASNLAIRGALARRPPTRIVTSVIEHPATTAPCDLLWEQGWTVSHVGVDAEGRVHVGAFADAVERRAALVTLMHAHNETGVMQPVAEIARVARAHGALVHTDAAQSLGKVPVDVTALGVDLLTIAGHKLYAPKGVGALYVRRGVEVSPVLLGAGHERGLRPGTENVASIVGLGAACDLARRTLDAEGPRLLALRDRLAAELAARVPGLVVTGAGAARLPNTLHVRFPGTTGRAVLGRAPRVLASTGSACHDRGELAPSVIVAMGVPEGEALGSVRLSLGRGTTLADVDEAAALLSDAYRASVTPPP